MTDGDALYRAVIADPADDTPRLVYADWLEEHDRAEEAEFVRLGCRLDAAALDHPEYTDWQARHGELALWLAAHAPARKSEFAAGLTVEDGGNWWKFSRRGFPSFLEFEGNGRVGLKPIRNLAVALEKAFDAVPTRWLVVRHLTNDQLRELLRQPVIAKLDRLTVQLYSVGEPNDEAVQLVADCRHLSSLRGLVLWVPFGDAGAAVLAGSEHLAKLEYLSVRGDGVTPAGARSLGRGAWRSTLRAFRAEGLLLGTVRALSEAGPLPALHTLELIGCAVQPAEWEAFAGSAAFPNLKCFKLERTNISGAPAEQVIGAPWFRPAHLSFDRCPIQTRGMRALVAAPWLGGLQRLSVRGNVLGAGDIAALVRSPALTGLRALDASDNDLGAAGLKALARNPALRGLVALDLAGHPHHTGKGVTPKHFEEFLAKLDLPHLRVLSLRGRPVGATAARALLAEKFASLRRLDLGLCRLTDPAVKSLVEAPPLQNLVELKLDTNNLKTGPEPLASRRVMPRLSACALDNNKLSDDLRKRLARRPGVVV